VDEWVPQLDEAVALSRVGGDVDLLREVAELFLGDYPESLANLRDAVNTHNAQLVEQHAHRLKGSVSTFGARGAFDAALSLERKGRAGDLAGAEDSLHALEVALAQLHPELEALQSR